MTQEQLRMQMLAGIITESQYKAKLNEEISLPFSEGDQVIYTNPTYHKEFKKDISFWTNTPKNEKIPFQVYIKDGAQGTIESLIPSSPYDIAIVRFPEDQFRFSDGVNRNKPYEISTKYLSLLN
jgi:hypothetical protein